MKQIGKFTVCGLLGKGGMGKVFKVRYPVTGKIGAMKLLDPNPILVSLLGMKTIEDMFEREAVTMAGIRHPHVVPILDYDRAGDRPFYIMDFYGDNLGSLMGESYETEKPSRRIPVDKALAYTDQILQGLARLHFSSLIHRDIKPFNILITDEDTVRICDFGLSKLRHETLKSHDSLKVGSPYYAPPEQEKDPDTVDFSADLYAVAVTLYRMVTGRLPVPPAKPPSQINRDLNPAWDRFIQKALSASPASRFTDAEQMRAELQTLAGMWTRQKASMSSLPSWVYDDLFAEEREERLRSVPSKISAAEAPALFRTDELMRPLSFIPNRFNVCGENTVKDEATGLVWQIGGTRFPVNLQGAFEYVRTLNRDRFDGSDAWRLPTAVELLSLVEPTPEGLDHGKKKVFDARQRSLWSSDRSTFITGWYVNMELGFAGFNDFDSFYHAKAVRSL